MDKDKGFYIKAGREEGQHGVLKIPKQEDIKYYTPCLLCGASIEIPHHIYGSKVCNECKELWRKFKEKDNG